MFYWVLGTTWAFSAKLPSIWPDPCTAVWSCTSPSGGLDTSPYWTSWSSCQLISPACQGHSTLWLISHPFQFGVIGKLIEGRLCQSILIQNIDENVEQDWIHYCPLGYTTSDWLQMDFSTGNHPVGTLTNSVFNSPHCWSSPCFISLPGRTQAIKWPNSSMNGNPHYSFG